MSVLGRQADLFVGIRVRVRRVRVSRVTVRVSARLGPGGHGECMEGIDPNPRWRQ